MFRVSNSQPGRTSWHQRLGLALLAAASITLVACGGGGSDGGTPSSSTTGQAPPSMQALNTDNETSVVISGSSGTATTSTGTTTTSTTPGTGTEVMSSRALDFEGKVNEGPSTGTVLKGKLTLDAKSTDGGKNFAVTGKLVTNPEPKDDSQLTDEQKAKIKEALKLYSDQVRVELEKFRRGVNNLAEVTEKLLKAQRDAYKAVDPTASDSSAKYQAIDAAVKATLDEFHKQLDALKDSLAAGVKAQSDQLSATLKAITPDAPAVQEIPVTGTLTAQGAISLTFDLGNGAKIEGVGQSDGFGKFTGTFTGPQAGDKGTWTADSCIKSPLPPTTPTPTTPGTTGTTSTTSTTPTLPPLDEQSCPVDTKVNINSQVSQVLSATSFKVAIGISVGPYIDGIPIDASAATYINGTAAEIAAGKQVKVCSDDTISLVGGSASTPIKAKIVILPKAN
jgi:hypothetical protein